MRPRLSPETLLLALLLPLAAEAAPPAVFKWVDQSGVTRYDDQSRLAERLTRATLARRKVAADLTASLPAEFVQEVARLCSDLADRRDSYASARELFARDPVGNQYRLSANQMALERAQMSEEATRYCRPLAAEKLVREARLAIEAEKVKTGTAARSAP